MNCGQFTFLCQLSNEAILPAFKGSTIRGAFGAALKRVVCANKRKECQNCLLCNHCIYALFFEKNICLSSTNRNTPANPHPFLIEPPLITKTRFLKGEEFAFKLLLFGRFIDYLPYCIYAFEQMGKIGIGKRINGKRSGFVLKNVSSGENIIYSEHDKRLINDNFSSEIIIQKPKKDARKLTVHLKTPLRLKYNNHLKADLPFHVLIRAALRRISSLFTIYDGSEPDLDYKGIVERARDVKITSSSLHWFDWERYSNRQKSRMFMGGIIGNITYTGNLTEFLSLLEICQKVHLGKQTTFGLGLITLETA